MPMSAIRQIEVWQACQKVWGITDLQGPGRSIFAQVEHLKGRLILDGMARVEGNVYCSHGLGLLEGSTSSWYYRSGMFPLFY